MPLIPVARAAVEDAASGAIHFIMKDGSKPVLIRVTATVTLAQHTSPEADRFRAFKLQRRRVERAASQKYAQGRIEGDGSVVVDDRDLAAASSSIAGGVVPLGGGDMALAAGRKERAPFRGARGV